MSAVRFFNLSEPVVPLFRHLGAALSARGSDVEFVVSRSSYRRGDEDLATAVPGGKAILTPGPSRQFATRLGRAVAMLAYWFGASWVIATRKKPAVNVFLTQPPCFVGLALRIARLRRQRSVVVVMDVHPDELVAFGVLRDGSIPERALRWLMDGSMKRADRIVVIGRCMRSRLAAKGIDDSRLVVIPNWVDDATIEPVDRDTNRVRQSLGWGDDFVVMYGGNVGYAQEFSTLIEAADTFTPDERIRIVVVGEGSKARHVREAIEKSSVGEYHRLLHRDFSLGEVLSAADVQFISLRSECTGLGVPSKTYAAMAAGRPILYEGEAEGEIALTVTESEIGTAIDSRDAAALVAAIRRMSQDRDGWSQLCKRSRATLDSHYATEHGVQRYVEALEPWL